MLLTIDIGNTHIKLGLYQGADLVHHWRMVTERHKLADEYAVLLHNLFAMAGLRIEQVEGCAISCVVPNLNSQFCELTRRYMTLDPVMVGPEIETGLRYEVETIFELGADRMTNSVAAYHTYGGPVIVVAFGTATVFDVVSAEGTYIGGAIAPGIGISAEALVRTAARLYQVELSRPSCVIGKNTIHHMQSGLIFGYTGLVEGLVSRMQHELGEACPVVATGGLAEVIAGETSVITVVEPFLTLEGLRMIYALNRENQE
jgi:type III pantothenate kinase